MPRIQIAETGAVLRIHKNIRCIGPCRIKFTLVIGVCPKADDQVRICAMRAGYWLSACSSEYQHIGIHGLPDFFESSETYSRDLPCQKCRRLPGPVIVIVKNGNFANT